MKSAKKRHKSHSNHHIPMVFPAVPDPDPCPCLVDARHAAHPRHPQLHRDAAARGFARRPAPAAVDVEELWKECKKPQARWNGMEMMNRYKEWYQ